MARAVKLVLAGLSVASVVSIGWSIAQDRALFRQQHAVSNTLQLTQDSMAEVIEVAEQAATEVLSGRTVNEAMEPVFKAMGSEEFQTALTSTYSQVAADYPNLPPNAEFAPTPDEFNAAYLEGLRKEVAAGRLRCDQTFSSSLIQDLANIRHVACKGRGKFRIKATFPKETSGEVEISNIGIKVTATAGT